MAIDRHDKSGRYWIEVTSMNTDVENYLKEQDIKFTRQTPTEIRAILNYEQASKCRSLARHSKMGKL